mgnify:FL=1
MSIFGQALKGTVGLLANGLDCIITASTRQIGKKYGDSDLVKTAGEIGSNTVRVTENTVKTLTDVVDGGLEAGAGYLIKDEVKVDSGVKRAKTAGKDLVLGVERGIAITYEAGAKTTGSAVEAGKHYFKGDKTMARQELANTKAHAKELGKLIVVGLLAFGAMDNGVKNKSNQIV